MTDPHRGRRRFAVALMVLAIVLLAIGCWRLYIWQRGQPGEFVRYDPSPLRADWDRMSERYEALTAKIRRDDPQASPDDQAALRTLEQVRERLVQDEEARLHAARRLELRLGLYAVVGAFVLFSAGYWRRDKLPTVG